MKARMSGLFDFTRNVGAARRSHAISGHAPVLTQEPGPRDSAKAAVADLITEPAKPGAKKENSARQERRHRRRVKISAPVRVRQVNVNHAAEFDLTMTADVSREGILFETSRTTYKQGQEVAVVFPYRPMPGEQVHEQRGQVVRVARASENRYGVAVAFLDGEPTYEMVDSLGNPLNEDPGRATERPKSRAKPLVVVVDADPRVRTLVRSELEAEGYVVEAVQDPSLAVTLLRHRSPAALICESEPFPGAMPGGGEMSGYDLCVIVRRNSKFAHLPVILTTRTGLPSDFATAHALGASVCVAKPYDLNRVSNLLRMLAPIE